MSRIVIVRVAEDRHRFIWNFHHILIDRWSMTPLFEELFSVYETLRYGMPLPPERGRPFVDYIDWACRRDRAEADRFWREYLAGFTRATTLLDDLAPHAAPSDTANFGSLRFTLGERETGSLLKWTQQQRLTINTLIQGAWALLLSHWSGSEDVVFGAIVPGRPADLAGSQDMIGMFVNTLPARVRYRPELALRQWLHEHQEDQVRMRQFDSSPLMDIQRLSDVPPGGALFHSAIGVQRTSPGKPSAMDLARDFGMSDFDFVDWNSLPLSVAVEIDSTIEVVMKFDHDRFAASARRRMTRDFEALLNATSRDAMLGVGELREWLGEFDRADLATQRQRHKQVGAQRLRALRDGKPPSRTRS